MALINTSKFELNLILGLKIRIFRLQWAKSFLYAVCWGCFMAHFVADFHSFKMSHERTPANGVQERSRALNSIFVIFQVFSGHKKSKKYMNIKLFSKYFFCAKIPIKVAFCSLSNHSNSCSFVGDMAFSTNTTFPLKIHAFWGLRSEWPLKSYNNICLGGEPPTNSASPGSIEGPRELISQIYIMPQITRSMVYKEWVLKLYEVLFSGCDVIVTT